MASPAAALPAPPQVRRNGRRVTLGRFATAEEAALCYARSPEGSNFAMLAAFKDWSSGGEEGGKEGGKEGGRRRSKGAAKAGGKAGGKGSPPSAAEPSVSPPSSPLPPPPLAEALADEDCEADFGAAVAGAAVADEGAWEEGAFRQALAPLDMPLQALAAGEESCGWPWHDSLSGLVNDLHGDLVHGVQPPPSRASLAAPRPLPPSPPLLSAASATAPHAVVPDATSPPPHTPPSSSLVVDRPCTAPLPRTLPAASGLSRRTCPPTGERRRRGSNRPGRPGAPVREARPAGAFGGPLADHRPLRRPGEGAYAR